MPSRFRLPRIGSSVPGGRKQYKIKKKLGAGGNGAVYSVDAYNPDGSLLPEKYAIKVFVPKKNNDERFLRFKNEIDIILSCSSEIEGLISVLDYHLSSCHERVDYSWCL